MNQLENLAFQHSEHREWLTTLNFYQDEIKVLQNELLLVLYEHPDNLSLLEHVEEYRGILLHKLQTIDELRHSIMTHERLLAGGQGSGKDAKEEHKDVGDRVAEFAGQLEDMKASFRRFVSHND